MKECPIIFSGQMVRAILEGRKTQTRRVAKITGVMGDKLPVTAEGERLIELEPGEFNRGVFHYESLSALSGPYRLPYAVGDTLWVREAWAQACELDDDDKPASAMMTYYRADGEPFSRWLDPDTDEWRDGIKWSPSIYMPRWASRITLRVTGVKVERLQDISRGDAMDEGCPHPNMQDGPNPRDWFSTLWGSIHGPGSWEANPWVCAITFERVQP